MEDRNSLGDYNQLDGVGWALKSATASYLASDKIAEPNLPTDIRTNLTNNYGTKEKGSRVSKMVDER